MAIRGAIIGDLAAWTWQHEHDEFYPNLISDKSVMSPYGHVIVKTWNIISKTPNIKFQEFQKNFQDDNWRVNPFLRTIAVASCAATSEELEKKVQMYALHQEKEEWYASHFLGKLIFALSHGASKKEATSVEHIGDFKSFLDGHWKEGDGSLSILVRAWYAFQFAFDFGSAIHNAIRLPGDRHLNCIIVGALADAMYGSGIYLLKKKYGESHTIQIPETIERILPQLNDNTHRLFFQKNYANTNVEKHHWMDATCPLHDKVITPELRRRILKAFYPGWDDRYGFYLDDGWIYVYRSGSILSRFKLKPIKDGTYRIFRFQTCDDKPNLTGIEEAMYSVEHHWNIIGCESNSRLNL